MNILTNGEFIKSINKVISGFGATPSNITLTNDQLDDVVDNQIFDQKMEELAAAAVPSGGGGSGRGGLVVKMVDNGSKLDKTAGEIINAMPFVWIEYGEISGSGAKSYLYSLIGGDDRANVAHYTYVEDIPMYVFNVIDITGDSLLFIAHGLDEYPTINK